MEASTQHHERDAKAGSAANEACAPSSKRHVAEHLQHAWRSPVAWIWLSASFALALAADLATKHSAFARIAGAPVLITREQVLALPPSRINTLIPAHKPIIVAPHALELQLVLNPGAVFGVGPGKRWFFVMFTALAILFALWVFATWTKPRDRIAHAALGLIVAGGVGNLFDRLMFGCVRDFLHPLPGILLPFGITWPGGGAEVWPWVSNVADALLLVGIATLLIRLWRSDSALANAPRRARH